MFGFVCITPRKWSHDANEHARYVHSLSYVAFSNRLKFLPFSPSLLLLLSWFNMSNPKIWASPCNAAKKKPVGTVSLL